MSKKIARFLLLAMIATLFIASTNASADEMIYANNAGGSGIQVYDAQTGALVQTINPSNVTNGRGVVKVGDILYYTEADQNSAFGYNLKTNTSLGAIFSVAGASGLATMAYNGTDFFLGDYSGTNNVYQYSLTGTLLNTIPLSLCTGYCDGLEYANGNLVSNEQDGGYGNPNSYDAYSVTGTLIQKGLITTSFGATGIAFDGTNYYVSDIFAGQLAVYNSSGTFLNFVKLQSPTNMIEDLSFDYTKVLNRTPEPGTLSLLALGALGLCRRRKKLAV